MYWVQVHTIGALLFVESNISISQLHTRIPFGLCLLKRAQAEEQSELVASLTIFFRWVKVTVVQLKRSAWSHPFSSLQWRIAVPAKQNKIQKVCLGRRTSIKGKGK